MPRSVRIELPDMENADYAGIVEAIWHLLDGTDGLADFYVRTDRQITAAQMSQHFYGWEQLQGRSGLR